jgi:hypothetical protein
MFNELSSRGREDGRATWDPQGVGPEAYLDGTSQGPTTEDTRKGGHICGRSRRFIKYAGYLLCDHTVRVGEGILCDFKWDTMFDNVLSIFLLVPFKLNFAHDAKITTCIAF